MKISALRENLGFSIGRVSKTRVLRLNADIIIDHVRNEERSIFRVLKVRISGLNADALNG